MGRNLYKLRKNFDDVIIVILSSHHLSTAKKVEGFRGFLLNISKTVLLIFIKLMMSFFKAIICCIRLELRSLQPLFYETSRMSDICSIFCKNVCIGVLHIF